MQEIEDMDFHEQRESSPDMFADSEEEPSSALGKEFDALKRHRKLCTDWKTTKVYVQFQDWNKPYPNSLVDIWDNHHVRLPWSSCNEFPKDGKVVKR